MKRILMFVHYNKENALEDRTLYSLNYLKELYDEIVIISNSKLSKEDEKRIGKFSSKILYRENIGYDFAAWRDGIKLIGWDGLIKYDELTLMNDTCYFPIFPIQNHVEQFENDSAIDFWGAYLYAATTYGMPGTGTVDYPGDPVPEHLQSYFISFKKKVIKSEVFQYFWDNIQEYSEVETVIREYETQLTMKLKSAGFKYDAMYKGYNHMYLHPEKVLKKKFPFLKVKAVHYYNIKHIKNVVKKSGSEYPTQLIVPIVEDKNIKLTVRSFLPEGVLGTIRWLKKNLKYIWALIVTVCIAYLMVVK